MKLEYVIAAAAFGFATPGSAAVVYSNGFDTENGGVSAAGYNAFNGLTVSDGTVNLVQSDPNGIMCEGGVGGCVDLTGNTNQAGNLTSGTFTYAAGEALTFQAGFSGSQRPGFGTSGSAFGFNFASPTDGVISFSDSMNGPLFSGSFTGADFSPSDGYQQEGIVNSENDYDAPFDDVSFTVIPTTSGSAQFFIYGSSPDPSDGNYRPGPPTDATQNNGGVGMIIDNVSLSVAPVPEPSTWAMTIAGFGLVGGVLRGRRAGAVRATWQDTSRRCCQTNGAATFLSG